MRLAGAGIGSRVVEAEALALGLRAANYDPTILTSGAGTVVPASIFNVSPSIPFGGLANSATGAEQGPEVGVRAGTSINLFQGVATSPAAGAGVWPGRLSSPRAWRSSPKARRMTSTEANSASPAIIAPTATSGQNVPVIQTPPPAAIAITASRTRNPVELSIGDCLGMK